MYAKQWLTVVCLLGCGLANAATVPDLYAAQVPVLDRTEEVRQMAFQDCLAAVLVKVSGDRQIVSNPDIVDLLGLAPTLVQQYRYTADKTLWTAFDGAALERILRKAGLPVWGSDRPAILLWLAVDWGGGSRGLITADEETDLRRSIERVASSRGLPIVWPLFDSTDRAEMSFSDLWGGFSEKIAAASTRYDTGGVLVGRASRGSGTRLSVRWTLEMGELKEQWRGGLSDGIHQVADQLGRRFSIQDLGSSGGVTVAVTGIDNLGAYARVYDYLENLSLVQHIGIQRIAGNTIVFSLDLLGDAGRLPRIIDLNSTLRPIALEDTPAVALSAEQRYRYSP